MSGARDYMRLDDEIDLRSEDSFRLKARRHSNTTSPQGIRDFAAADYWFGKRYFECVLAQDIFICLGRDKEAATIDGQFEMLVRNYPYNEAFQWFRLHYPTLLDPQITPQKEECYRALLTLIGTVVRLGSRTEKRTLLALIRKNLSDSSRSAKELVLKQTQVEVATREQAPPNSISDAATSGSGIRQLSQYTTMLQNKADQKKIIVGYQIEKMSDNPDLFKAVVTIQGSVFEGTGQTKKEAKHRASKVACVMLGLEN